MSISELINEIVSEWAYRVDDGMPDVKNQKHIAELSKVLSEMGYGHITNELIETITEAESKQFKNPALNKEIPYKDKNNKPAKGIVGNLLRLPKDHPGRKAAEAQLPPEGSEDREAMNKDLGSEKDGKSTGGDDKQKKPEDGQQQQGGGEEEKAKAVQAMFDPNVDPAMGARLDREKETNAKLAQKDKEDKAAEDGTEEENPLDAKFNPIEPQDVAKEMPEADPETFGGGSEIPDGIEPAELKQFNTDINKVAQQVADAKAKGEPAPNINLCQVTVPGTNLYCDDNLGIPRSEMPQFKGTAQPGSRAASMEADASGEVDTEPVFREMLQQKGIKTLQTEVPADKLKATQSELVGAKVVGMMGALEKDPNHPKITAPIYVSRDGFVIDGHHRWAAIVAYNAQHPDSQIPMKTTVLDMDIKDAIPMANKFAEDMGIAAKKADANKEDATQPKAAEVKPNETDATSNVKTFKGETSGKEIKTVEFKDGGFLFGTQHGDTKMADDIINQVKASVPKERWKDIVFVGEGGTTGDGGQLQFHDEMEYSAPKFKEMGASIDTWDGDELDVHNDQSALYKSQEEQTGLSQSKIKAGNWASMIGQGEGTDTMSPNDFLDNDGKDFLQQSAKEAGLPPIENWDEPTEQDKDTLYRLSFPEDNGDKETAVNDVQVAFNKARDLNLIKKQKQLAASGKIPVVMAGESHAELVDDIMKGKTSTEKLPEPKPANEKPGGVIYSIGGGYYSDTPDGPAQYVTAESIVEKVLIEGDESLAYLLFEAVVSKVTVKGKKIRVQPIEPKKQKRATAIAKKEKEKVEEPEEPDFSKMKPAQLKKFVEDRISQAEADFDKSKNKSKFAIDFMLKRQAEINNNYLRPAGSPASSLGELNGGKYINQIWKTKGKPTAEEEAAIIDEIMQTELAQQIPLKDRKRWAKIALETAKTEVKVLLYQPKYKAAKVQKDPYPMGVIMDKQSKAMLKKHFQEMMKNAQTPKEKKHYQKQLDYIDSLVESDTGVMYQREDGTVGFKHTSNKSAYNDPHNNTSVDEKIKAMKETLGGKLDPKLEKAFVTISQKVAEASAGIEDACRKFDESRDSLKPAEKNAQDAIIAKVVSAFPVRGGGKKNYLDDCKGKKWFDAKAAELGIETPVKSEKDAVTVVIACAGDTPPPTAAIKVLTKVSELLERTTKDNVDKTAPLFNLTADELSSLAQTARGLRDAAKTRRDVMGEAHTELVSAIQKADKATTPPSYPYDKNADNGPNQQAYVKDFLHRMHFSSYILGERDGVSSQNIGGDNVEPEYYRNCLAQLSGYTGKLDTPEGRQGLVSHLEKRVRISPKDDSIIFVNGKTKSELGKEVYRTKGESKSVVSGLGKEMQGCLKGKAKEANK